MMADLHHLLAIYVHAHQTGNSVPPHIDAEARTALAEPKRPPNDLEIDALVHDCLEKDGYSLRVIIRAALARYGYRPLDSSPPADGEVAELVEDLREQANHGYCEFISGDDLRRAAELLQRQVLVAVTWQPIETAPRDGTEILASDYDAIEIVSWKTYEAGSDWESRWGEVMFPAWWQPLPDHPDLPEVDE